MLIKESGKTNRIKKKKKEKEEGRKISRKGRWKLIGRKFRNIIEKTQIKKEKESQEGSTRQIKRQKQKEKVDDKQRKLKEKDRRQQERKITDKETDRKRKKVEDMQRKAEEREKVEGREFRNAKSKIGNGRNIEGN